MSSLLVDDHVQLVEFDNKLSVSLIHMHMYWRNCKSFELNM